MPRLERRSFLTIALGAAASSALPRRAAPQLYPTDRLMQPGPLPEKVFGDTKAPITVIEYASMTCHHCLDFHTKTWPGLKAGYVDAGKVRFIFREFPFDVAGLAAAMVARCAGDEKWYAMIDLLFRAQESWSRAANPAEGLVQTVAQAGMSREQLDTCLQDKTLADAIVAVRDRATKEFGVRSTPTFFINGVKHRGALTLPQLDAIFEMELASRPN